VSELVGRSVGWSVGWLVGRSIGWFVGRLVGWPVGWLVGRSVQNICQYLHVLLISESLKTKICFSFSSGISDAGRGTVSKRYPRVQISCVKVARLVDGDHLKS
jgi:hypothetical protein